MTLRALLVVLLLALIAGTPGLGLETRTGSSILIGVLYGVPFLAVIGALIASWRWPRATTRLAWVAAASAALLAALDLLGLTDPVRPPLAIAVLDVVVILAGVGILVLSMRGSAMRGSARPA